MNKSFFHWKRFINFKEVNNNMVENQRPILVLFGSQTGNSESIAQDLNEKLLIQNVSSRCLSLNDVAKTPLEDSVRAVIIVCSTTGNGDSPDNADKYWRTIKKRTIAKDTFSGLSFCVLALGDTNYDKFCYMGKSIDKRMKELGGHRFLDLHCADEATGLEEVVEEFNSKVVSSLLKLLAEDIASNNQVPIPPELEEKKDFSQDNKSEIGPTSCSLIIPKGAATLFDVCNFLDISPILMSTLPEPSLLLKRRKSGEGCVEILQTRGDIITSEKFETRENGEYDVAHPYKADVLEASWLTSPDGQSSLGNKTWEEERTVITLELGITGSGIQYQPGDYISIIAPNPLSFVNLMIERLEMELIFRPSCCDDKWKISADTYIRRNGEILTLKELFQYRLDLVGIPRKACVFALSEHCSDVCEANAMKWLCSKGDIGKKLWSNFVESQSLGIAEVLAMFPSCRPPLHVLVTFLSPLAPRPYSVASSPLAHPSSVIIAFSVVRYSCGLSTIVKNCTGDNKSDFSSFCIRRSGLCTSYLEETLQPFLRADDTNHVESLRILWKPSVSFRLPGNVASPLILIGPGTGVSPFIGFLENRSESDRERSQSGEDTTTGLWRGGFELDEASGTKLPHEGNAIDNFIQHVDPGSIFLFYGCRNEDDWLFKESMLQFLANGTLTALEVAMSRQTSEKVYVTHKLLAKGKELAPLLLTCNAHVYICGDGNQMAKDVTNALVRILHEHGDLSEEHAQEFLDDMRSRRRLLMDVWS